MLDPDTAREIRDHLTRSLMDVFLERHGLPKRRVHDVLEARPRVRSRHRSGVRCVQRPRDLVDSTVKDPAIARASPTGT